MTCSHSVSSSEFVFIPFIYPPFVDYGNDIAPKGVQLAVTTLDQFHRMPFLIGLMFSGRDGSYQRL